LTLKQLFKVTIPGYRVIILYPFTKVHEIKKTEETQNKSRHAFKNEIPQGRTIKFSTTPSLCIALKRFTL